MKSSNRRRLEGRKLLGSTEHKQEGISFPCLMLFFFIGISFVSSFQPLHHPYRTRISNLNQQFVASESSETTSASDEKKYDDKTNSKNPFQLKPAKSLCVTGVTPKSGPLNEAVVAVLQQHDISMSLKDANNLVSIGAVWARMEALNEEDVLALYENDSSSNSRALYADLKNTKKRSNGNGEEDLNEYIEQMENQRFRRILSPSWIQAGTDLRIYPQPRRFASCSQMTRDNSLLYEDTTFIVIDKPPMLPTQPDASNYYECAPACAQSQLGPFYDIEGNEITRPLLCHRVDSCVGGCVVLSKDANGQKVFQQFQRDRKLRKMYLAVTTKPVPIGIHIHWMWADQTARGKIGGPPCQLLSLAMPESRRKARQFWNRCVLEVTDCIPIQITDMDPEQQYYQSTIRLVTGRKHQVRAQLASLGCPIIRDTLYEPIAGMTLDWLEQHPDNEQAMDAAVASCRVPTEPIGLQAAGILFGGIRVKANTPWWGNDIVRSSKKSQQ